MKNLRSNTKLRHNQAVIAEPVFAAQYTGRDSDARTVIRSAFNESSHAEYNRLIQFLALMALLASTLFFVVGSQVAPEGATPLFVVVLLAWSGLWVCLAGVHAMFWMRKVDKQRAIATAMERFEQAPGAVQQVPDRRGRAVIALRPERKAITASAVESPVQGSRGLTVTIAVDVPE